MPFDDGIPSTRKFAVSDFTTYDFCQLKFFVFKYLGKKYELSQGSPALSLGTVLDESIKKFHKAKAYGQPKEYLANIVRAAVADIRERAAKNPDKKSFHSASAENINEELIEKAIKLFQEYYLARDSKINRSLGEVKFSKVPIEGTDGQLMLWGWPDTYELGEDGVPEVVDYKSRENMSKGNLNLNMDLLSKAYILLSAEPMLKMGYQKAKFRIRFWQDPKEESYFEEFDLMDTEHFKEYFRDKMERILRSDEIVGCSSERCEVCGSPEKDALVKDLVEMGYKVVSSEHLLLESS